MACGKTHRGKEMADELGIRFIDLDAYITDRERRSVPEILQKKGRPDFENWKPAICRKFVIYMKVLCCRPEEELPVLVIIWNI